VSAFGDVRATAALRIWGGVSGRVVAGERSSLVVVELDPGSEVAEHSHPHEQLGVLVEGSLRFRIGDETRELGPGATWSIPGGVPHQVVAGPEGALAVESFAPPREDFAALAQADAPSRWPAP
jgi:quercetin dioxygenase-like cupin family protein